MRRLTSQRFLSGFLPVVSSFLTAHGIFNYAYEACRMLACDYVLKPEDVECSVRRAMELLRDADVKGKLISWSF